MCGKATAHKRESHSNLADNLAMSLRAVSISDVPSQHISLNQRDRGGQVDLVTGETALVSCKFSPPDRSSRQFTERIEAAELKTAVVAEKLMQSGDSKND